MTNNVHQLKTKLEVEARLESHIKEDALRYKEVTGKLSVLDKRTWRIENFMMASTVTLAGLVVSVVTAILMLV